jgi:hypothetical protein
LTDILEKEKILMMGEDEDILDLVTSNLSREGCGVSYVITLNRLSERIPRSLLRG